MKSTNRTYLYSLFLNSLEKQYMIMNFKNKLQKRVSFLIFVEYILFRAA
jgi:hypothetical protein